MIREVFLCAVDLAQGLRELLTKYQRLIASIHMKGHHIYIGKISYSVIDPDVDKFKGMEMTSFS